MKKSILYTIAALTIAVFTFTAFEDGMTAQEKQQADIDNMVAERVAEFKAEKDAECEENALQIAMVQADSISTAKSTASKTRKKKKSSKPKPPSSTTTTSTYSTPTTTTTYTPPPTTTTTTTTYTPGDKPKVGKGSSAPGGTIAKPKPNIGKGKSTPTTTTTTNSSGGTITVPVPKVKKPLLGKGKGKGGK